MTRCVPMALFLVALMALTAQPCLACVERDPQGNPCPYVNHDPMPVCQGCDRCANHCIAVTSSPSSPPSTAPSSPPPTLQEVVRSVEQLCHQLRLSPEECASNAQLQDFMRSLTVEAKQVVLTATAKAGPVPPTYPTVSSSGADVSAIFQDPKRAGVDVIAFDRVGQPYSNVPVTATMQGKPPVSGTTDGAGMFKASFPTNCIGKELNLTVGAPLNAEVGKMKMRTWVVIRKPR